MAEKIIKVCDRCGSEKDVERIKHPVSGDDLDLCDQHKRPCSHFLSFEVQGYHNSYPSNEELDIELRLTEPGVAEIWCEQTGLLGQVTLDQARMLAVIVSAAETKRVGAFDLTTAKATLPTGVDFDDIENFDLELLVAFLEHDWTEGDFEY